MGMTNEQSASTKRVTVYDWLRLIAMIFVVIGHSAYLEVPTRYGGVAYALPDNVLVPSYA